MEGVKMKDNIILVDCDGVLCDWEYSFTQYMHHKGIPTVDDSQYNVGNRFGLTVEEGKNMVREFNDSAAIAFLPPLRDAVYYMKRLNMLHGYKFHVITSLSTNKYAQKLRIQNLELLFGKELFDDFFQKYPEKKKKVIGLVLKVKGKTIKDNVTIPDNVNISLSNIDLVIQEVLKKPTARIYA